MHPRVSSWGVREQGKQQDKEDEGGGGKKDDEAVEAMTRRGSGAEGEGPDGDGGCR